MTAIGIAVATPFILSCGGSGGISSYSVLGTEDGTYIVDENGNLIGLEGIF